MKLIGTMLVWIVFAAGISAAHADDLFSLADRLFEAGHYVKARPVYEKVIESAEGTNEQRANAYFRLGQCLYYMNKTDHAIDCFKTVVDTYPAAIVASASRKWLGDCHVILHELDTAILTYRALLNDGPDTTIALTTKFEVAVTLFRKKDYAASLAEFNEFIEQYPEHSLIRSAKFYIRRIENASK